MASLYQDPYALWYAGQQREKPAGLHALLFPTGSLEPRAPLDRRQSRAFHDVGLACSHSNLAEGPDNVALLFRSCPFGGISHAFADQNTYDVHAYGEPLIIASGYYQLYGCPHHQEWTRQTLASNSVLVDEHGQQRTWQAKGQLRTCQSTLAGDYLVGDAHEAYPGLISQYDRQILYLRGLLTGSAPVIVIRDDLAAPQPATWQFLLHALNEMQLDVRQQRVEIASGQARCRVEFLEPGQLTFRQTDKFTQPPPRGGADQWHLTASTTAKDQTTHSLFVIQPYRAGSNDLANTTVEHGNGAIGFRLRWAGREVLAGYRTEPNAGEVSIGEYRFDGQAVALGLRDGACYSAAQFGGKYLAKGRSYLVQCSVAGAAGWGNCGNGQLAEIEAGERASLRIPAGQFTQCEPQTVLTLGDPAGSAAKPAALATPSGPVAWERQFYPRVPRLVLTAPVELPGGTYSLKLALNEKRGQAAPVLATAGGASIRAVVPPRGSTTLEVSTVSLAGKENVTLAIDSTGEVSVAQAALARVYNVNLLPNPSFEQTEAGVPAGWSPGSITNGAQCTIDGADGGHQGKHHLRVTCTRSGGDFSDANLQWPGIPASSFDRKFELGCWVKTPPNAVAGIQVMNNDWHFSKSTSRLGNKLEWTETRVEFTLPAGTDLTHLRLHLSADEAGTAIEADDVCLREVE